VSGEPCAETPVLLAELVEHQHNILLLRDVRDLDRRGDANCRKHDGRDRQKHERSEGRERGHGGALVNVF